MRFFTLLPRGWCAEVNFPRVSDKASPLVESDTLVTGMALPGSVILHPRALPALVGNNRVYNVAAPYVNDFFHIFVSIDK